MATKRKVIAATAAAAVVVGAATGIGIAASADDDRPLHGTAEDRAVRAALDYVGGGRVLETEGGDGGAAYAVEIARDDGSVVEVQLDARFHVIGVEKDDDDARSENESGESGEA